MLELVELGAMARRKPPQLSGGQQQRVAVARALINHPEVLLLDEPLGALDLKLRRQMQIELKRIQTEVGITFVHVTHDQEEAMTMADTIAVMNEGRIEQLGGPAELYENPHTTFVANFLGPSNLRRGDRDGHRRRRPRPRRPGRQGRDARQLAGRAVTPTCSIGVRPEKIPLVPTGTVGRRRPATRCRAASSPTPASSASPRSTSSAAVGPGADGLRAEPRQRSRCGPAPRSSCTGTRPTPSASTEAATSTPVSSTTRA